MKGISFLIRARNEEKVIERCIRSLSGIKVPHEIVVVLNSCTDKTEEIVRGIGAGVVRICHYDVPLSRAGVENLITPKDNAHSLVAMCNYMHALARMNWTFKWDADFVATDGLVEWINENSSLFSYDRSEHPINVHISAIDRDQRKNTESYLSNCVVGYGKYGFWEVQKYSSPSPTVVDAPYSAYIIHDSSLSDMKPYWSEAPWWSEYDSSPFPLMYRMVLDMLQITEEPGMAMASNEKCDDPFYRVLSKRDDLRHVEIHMDK